MRNWHCACAPGLLGPPQPVMPLVLQCAVETSARSAPLSWSISGCSTSCTAVISWASEPSTTPPSSSSSSQLFPTAILNAVGDQRAPDLSWSVSCVAGVLSARLSWSTSPPAESAPSSPLPSSPPSDDGYFSASPPAVNQTTPLLRQPIFAQSPIECPPALAPSTIVKSARDVATQSSNETSKILKDAASATDQTESTTVECQTPVPPTMVSEETQTSTNTESFSVALQTPKHFQAIQNKKNRQGRRSLTNTKGVSCQTEPTNGVSCPNTSTKGVSCQTEATVTETAEQSESKPAQRPINLKHNKPKGPPANIVSTCKLCLASDLTFHDLRRHYFECTGHPSIEATAESHESVLQYFTREALEHLKLPPNSDYSVLFEPTNQPMEDTAVQYSWMDDMLVYGDESCDYEADDDLLSNPGYEDFNDCDY